MVRFWIVVLCVLVTGCAEMAYRDAFDHPGGPGHISVWESKLQGGESGVRMEPAITEALGSELWIGVSYSTAWNGDAWLVADALDAVVFDLQAPMTVQAGKEVFVLQPVLKFDGGDYGVRSTDRYFGAVEYRRSTRKAFRISLGQLRLLALSERVVFRVVTTGGFMETYSRPQDGWRSTMEAYPDVWFAGALPIFLQAVK
jgi:hypothetical protein